MRARWVLTWKSTGNSKARLCMLGFQDPDLTEVPRDSPTLSAASEGFSGDIKTAFPEWRWGYQKHFHITT